MTAQTTGRSTREELKFRYLNGHCLYLPWGIGRAYLLPDAATEQRVRRWLKTRRMTQFATTIALGGGAAQLHFNLAAAILVILALYIVLWLAVDLMLVRNLKVVSEMAGAQEIINSSRIPEPLFRLVLMLLGSLAFVAAGAYMFLSGQQIQETVAILCSVFFGLCALVSCIRIAARLWARFKTADHVGRSHKPGVLSVPGPGRHAECMESAQAQRYRLYACFKHRRVRVSGAIFWRQYAETIHATAPGHNPPP